MPKLIRGNVGGRVWERRELAMVGPGRAVPRVAFSSYIARREARIQRHLRWYQRRRRLHQQTRYMWVRRKQGKTTVS